MSGVRDGTVTVRNWATMLLAIVGLVGIINTVAFRLLDIEVNSDTREMEERLHNRIHEIDMKHDSVARFMLCRVGTFDIAADSLACEAYILGSRWRPFINQFRRRDADAPNDGGGP